MRLSGRLGRQRSPHRDDVDRAQKLQPASASGVEHRRGLTCDCVCAPVPAVSHVSVFSGAAPVAHGVCVFSRAAPVALGVCVSPGANRAAHRVLVFRRGATVVGSACHSAWPRTRCCADLRNSARPCSRPGSPGLRSVPRSPRSRARPDARWARLAGRPDPRRRSRARAQPRPRPRPRRHVPSEHARRQPQRKPRSQRTTYACASSQRYCILRRRHRANAGSVLVSACTSV